MAYTTIDDPSKHHQTKVYTGNGSSNHAITFDGNSNMQPDWLWNKVSSEADSHASWDSSRGNTKLLYPNITLAEDTDGNGNIESFDSNGFTVGGNQQYANHDGATQVTWAWKANGGTTTSFSASGAQLAGTRQTNATAGFSIILYTGDGNNNATIPHGLNSPPKWVLIKDRGDSSNWYVGHKSTFSTGEVFLNTDAGIAGAFGPFNKTAPDANNITLGTDGSVNGNNDTFVAYVFADVKGYSKFSSYEGIGGTNGPFVYTGFRPAWLMYRNIDRTENWIIVDTKRNPVNRVTGANLQANVTDAQVNELRWGFDFLSNGFKVRQNESQNANNGDGETIIYMAFAEHPFVTSKGVPVPAR
tara:strand:- start:1843 stop:2916 length:1074 start_codon:yes stop_codon:yes gene_type:complete